MKKVEAIIRMELLGAVKEALENIGVTSLNVMEVKGQGEEVGFKQQWRAFEYAVQEIPRIRLETVVKDAVADAVAQEILRAAWTGSVGDGMLIVSSVIDAVRVRTGERGDEAI
jgi:nitrogen regulatory protein PII